MALCHSTVLAKEPCHEGHAALGTTATWWHLLELQAWWSQKWPHSNDTDSTRKHISWTGHRNPPSSIDYIPIGACSFVN